jgi:hypothetical protein
MISFNNFSEDRNVDCGEKIGNFGLGLLRIGLGRTVKVKKSKIQEYRFSSAKLDSFDKRFFALALFFLLLPITSILALIGYIAKDCSKSYKIIFNLYVTQKQDVIQERRLPPLNGDQVPIDYNKTKNFENEDIVSKLPISKRKEIHVEGGKNFFCKQIDNWTLEVRYSQHGKAIIQQQSIYSCTAASSAMLIFDKGGTPNWNLLKTRGESQANIERDDIEQAGYNPIETKVKTLKVESLRELILNNGSCIVNLPGHALVVDEVSEDLLTVRLRDPCHGWEITVNSAAFEREWDTCPYYLNSVHIVYQIGDLD